jgi:hypothetical protein
MSIVEILPAIQKNQQPISAPMHWRLPVLSMLLLGAIALNSGFLTNHFYPDGPLFPFMLFFLAGFVPYLVACGIILTTRAQRGRWLWIELGLIVCGALVLRAMLLRVDPFLSPDSWRYLWDARITLHGYSPYVYAPQNPVLASLRNANYSKMGFRHVPTIYPPGAQAVYLISYLIAPDSLVALKGIFLLFDLLTCVALAYWLKRRGLDPARAVIYAWCPLPIIDFAIQGHLDVLAITFSVLAVVSSSMTWRGSRVLTGFLIGMATLAKIYPLLLLVVIIRRRDWTLFLACLITILAGYFPYVLLGHGQVFGFFSQYATDHSPNSGLIQQIMKWWYFQTGFYNAWLERLIDAMLFGGIALHVLFLRLQERMSMEAAILILTGTLFVISPHIFPWYTPALLPWAAVLLQPVWRRQGGLNPKGLAVATAWYFPCVIVLHYFFDRLSDWTLYYVVVYDVMLLGIGIAVYGNIKRRRDKRQQGKCDRSMTRS